MIILSLKFSQQPVENVTNYIMRMLCV